jgi:cadmium resistance protein CadD (predicted permease)
MSPSLPDLSIGIVVFVATNIDDLFVVAAFLADPGLRRRAVVAGQYLGIGALVLTSALAAWLVLAVPEGWVALLGVLPLALGLRKLVALRWEVRRNDAGVELGRVRAHERAAELRLHSQALAIAGVTVANGGDNLGAYVPLFATAFDLIAAYALIFAVMTGLWCALAYLLVNNPVLGPPLRRYGHVALPVVLIALGLYILSGALVLLR